LSLKASWGATHLALKSIRTLGLRAHKGSPVGAQPGQALCDLLGGIHALRVHTGRTLDEQSLGALCRKGGEKVSRNTEYTNGDTLWCPFVR